MARATNYALAAELGDVASTPGEATRRRTHITWSSPPCNDVSPARAGPERELSRTERVARSVRFSVGVARALHPAVMAGPLAEEPRHPH